MVVGYSQRQRVALLILMARQALTAAARQVDRETGRGSGHIQQAEARQRGARGLAEPAARHPLARPVHGVSTPTHLWEGPWTSGPLARALASSNTLRGRWVAGGRGHAGAGCGPFSLAGPALGHTHQHTPPSGCHPGSWPATTPEVIASTTSNQGCCHLPSPWLPSIMRSSVITATARGGGGCCFSDEETEAERVSGLPKVRVRKPDLCSGRGLFPFPLTRPCAPGPGPCLCPQDQPGLGMEMGTTSNFLC